MEESEEEIVSQGYSSLRKPSSPEKKQLRYEARMYIKEKSAMKSNSNSFNRRKLRKDKSKTRMMMTQPQEDDDDVMSNIHRNNNDHQCVIHSRLNHSNQLSSLDTSLEAPAGVDEIEARNEMNLSPSSSSTGRRIPFPPPRTSINKTSSASTLLFSNHHENNNDLSQVIHRDSHTSINCLTSDIHCLDSVTSLPCVFPVGDNESNTSDKEKVMVKSQSNDTFKSVIEVSSPSHVVVNILDSDPLARTRDQSPHSFMEVKREVGPTSKLTKWRGTNLTDHQYLQGIRDEQDSGFDDVTPKTTLDKPLVRNYLEVTLEKGWTSRLGIQLMDDPNKIPPDFCVVKGIIDHTVASQNGRIKEGYKMTTVNGMSLEGKTAKEVIEFLRRVKGKIHMKFLIPSS